MAVVDYGDRDDEGIPNIRKYRLPKTTSVYRGEIIAIQKAVEKIATEHISTAVAIYSDSLSSLMTLKNPFTDDVTACTIREIIQQKDLNVLLAYIPAHKGFDGNETADQAAKEAIYDTCMTTELDWPSLTSKSLTKSRTQQTWQELWENSEKGRWTFDHLPDVADSDGVLVHLRHGATEQEQVLLHQALSGHIPCHAYLHRFKLRDDAKCPNCGNTETIDHIILDCPKFDKDRLEFQLLHLVENEVCTINLINPRTSPLVRKILRRRFKMT